MKILVVGRAFPYRGGIASFNERLASELSKQGHEIKMYTFTHIYPIDHQSLFCENRNGQRSFCIEPKINNANPLPWKSIAKEINEEKYDLIIYCYAVVAAVVSYTYLAKHINKSTKQILFAHNIEPDNYKTIGKKLVAKMLQQMDGMVSMSKKVIHDAEKINKSCLPHIFSPHPIYDHLGNIQERNKSIKRLDLNANYRYVLFFGAIKQSKGLDLLVEAFADKRIAELPIKLLVVGDFRNNRHIYDEIVYQHHLQDKTIFIDDYVPDSEVPYCFGVADIVAQPYKKASQSGILQAAYHFEKPILITHTADSNHSVPHGHVGYVINPQVNEIADSLVDFFENKRQEEMSQAVKKEKAKFAWENMTKSIEKFSLSLQTKK